MKSTVKIALGLSAALAAFTGGVKDANAQSCAGWSCAITCYQEKYNLRFYVTGAGRTAAEAFNSAMNNCRVGATGEVLISGGANRMTDSCINNASTGQKIGAAVFEGLNGASAVTKLAAPEVKASKLETVSAE